MSIGFNSLNNLAKIRKDIKRKRISSYDPTGANADFNFIKSRQKHVIFDINGAGIIRHIWMTLACSDPLYLRKAVIRMWWDDEPEPSVECPIGDFFGVGHAKAVNYWSLPLSMGPQDGKGFNCFFPMPFSKRAKIEVENETDVEIGWYYYIDYEEYKELDDDYGRFHVTWHRENPCKGSNREPSYRKNPTHENDFLLFEAEGEGHYVGCHVDIHNLKVTSKHNWPGEGDDYIEIDDGEIILYGTGTEDYFCTSWCPSQYYCSPYFGIPLPGGKNWSGKISYYRYHIEDPIYLRKISLCSGVDTHANQRSDDWSSTAYWYQTEPHRKFKPLLPVTERLPRDEPKEIL